MSVEGLFGVTPHSGQGTDCQAAHVFVKGRARAYASDPGGSDKECLEKKIHRSPVRICALLQAGVCSSSERLSHTVRPSNGTPLFKNRFLFGNVMGDFPGSSPESCPGQGFSHPVNIRISRVTNRCLRKSALKSGIGANYGRF